MKFTCVVLNLDGKPDAAGDVFGPDLELQIAENVKVTHDFKNRGFDEEFLGNATLTREAGLVKAEIDINVEKIPVEILKTLTPAIGGVVLERDGNTIKKCKINQIGLSISGNADPRIKKLGEQT